MSTLFTSESVSEGHPDKIADQISDNLLDNFLAFDPLAKVACETLVTTGQVILAGEVKSNVYLDLQDIARETINNIGYNKGEYQFSGDSCGVISMIHEQSKDINRGVEKKDIFEQGAGDQGMMFGYATNETENHLPLALDLSHKLVSTLSNIRKENDIVKYLRPDAKAQVTIEYLNGKPKGINTIVLSTQHDEFDKEEEMLNTIKKDILKHLIPQVKSIYPKHINRLFDDNITYHINPTGKFVIGGPHGDTGLTGRKIIVDTYGGEGSHGGGAFSGKDPSKVDRSAAYATRHIAKNLVVAGICDKALVQVSYAIGIPKPTSLNIKTFNTSKVSMSDEKIGAVLYDIFDLRPYSIQKRLKLSQPMYLETASYGHMGRTPKTIKKHFYSPYSGSKDIEVELFTWEKLDYVDTIRKAFKI